MSYSFRVDVQHAPAMATFIAKLKYPDLRCTEFEECQQAEWRPKPFPAAAWPEGIFHFYHDHMSNRGIELTYADGKMQVRIMTLSCPQDYRLARTFIAAFAAGAESLIENEERRRFAVTELEQEYGDDWAAGQNEAGLRALIATLRQDPEGVVTLPGIRRAFVVGKRLLAELSEGGPKETLCQRLIERMRKVQYVGSEWYMASVMQIERPAGEPFTLCVWAANVSYYFPAAKYLCLNVPDGEMLLVPREKLSELAGERCTLLDETQALVKAIPAAEWPALLARARHYEVTLNPPAHRQWWQFWK